MNNKIIDVADLAYGTPDQNPIATTQFDRALEVTYKGTSFIEIRPVNAGQYWLVIQE